MANHGIWKRASIEEMTPEQWSETIRTNLDGVYALCHHAARVMIPQRRGSLILVTSTSGQRGEAHYSHYSATKGALLSFTKSLAAELAPHGIRVNAVAPGWVLTDMTRETLQGPEGKEAVRPIPLGRAATPEEIAGPVAFLASDLASYLYGEVLSVNGGAVMNALSGSRSGSHGHVARRPGAGEAGRVVAGRARQGRGQQGHRLRVVGQEGDALLGLGHDGDEHDDALGGQLEKLQGVGVLSRLELRANVQGQGRHELGQGRDVEVARAPAHPHVDGTRHEVEEEGLEQGRHLGGELVEQLRAAAPTLRSQLPGREDRGAAAGSGRGTSTSCRDLPGVAGEVGEEELRARPRPMASSSFVRAAPFS